MPEPSNGRSSTSTAAADVLRRWNEFWFAPATACDLAATRVVLASLALWVVLSRNFPEALDLPMTMWRSVGVDERFRFGIIFPRPVEDLLFAALHASLLLTIVGVFPRVAAFVSGLLLYHFAPFETIIWTPNPYLRGLTFSTLGLLILSFTPDLTRATLRSGAPAARWPVLLMQIIVAQMYFFAGYAKLVTSGWAWAGEENMRRWLLLLEQTYGVNISLPLGYRLASIAGVPSLIGWTAVAFELLFPLAVVSRRARCILVPAAVIFHSGNVAIFHIVFQELPVLLLFVTWPVRRTSSPRPSRETESIVEHSLVRNP